MLRTCAYYRTSARAMCVRKCVRKGSGTVRAEVRAYVHIFDLRLRSHFFTKSFNQLCRYFIFSILMYVVVHSFLSRYLLPTCTIRYFPPKEEEGTSYILCSFLSLMAGRDWLYGAHNAADNLIIRKVQVMKMSKMIESKICTRKKDIH